MKTFTLKRGFTLVELIVVVGIIAALSAIVLASLGDARMKSRDAKRIADIKQIELAMEIHYDIHGAFPDPTNDWQSDIDDFLSSVPTDPLNDSEYTYANSCDGTQVYVLYANLEKDTESNIADTDCAGASLGDNPFVVVLGSSS